MLSSLLLHSMIVVGILDVDLVLAVVSMIVAGILAVALSSLVLLA